MTKVTCALTFTFLTFRICLGSDKLLAARLSFEGCTCLKQKKMTWLILIFLTAFELDMKPNSYPFIL